MWGTDLIVGGKEMDRPPLPTFAYENDIDGTGKTGFELMMPESENDPLEPYPVEKMP